MTSDHRVAGSSPAGCKGNIRNDLGAVLGVEKEAMIGLSLPESQKCFVPAFSMLDLIFQSSR